MSPQPSPFRHPSFRALIGVARRDITPPVGIYARNWGAAKRDVAEGIHRPLTATALVVSAEDAQPPIVLVALDLCAFFFPDTASRIRREILDAIPTESSRVMINLGHTHSGGPILLDPSMAGFPGGEHIGPYLSHLAQAVKEAVLEASKNRKDSTLDWSYGRCGLATNRDLPDPDGDGCLCGFNPDIAVDDTLLVGRVIDSSGKLFATIVNYACHPTTLAWENNLISPDYLGALREVVESQTGGALTLFLQGSSGELAPREQYSGDPGLADRHGRQVGYAVLSTLEGMLPPNARYEYDCVVESGARLATWKYAPSDPPSDVRVLELRVDLPLKEDWPTSEEIQKQVQTCQDRVQAERLRRKMVVRSWLGEASVFSMPVWVWKLGDAIVIGHHTETYSQLQTDLRALFPGHALVVMNLVNGTVGYQPPRSLYGQDIYQVWQTPLAEGALEKLIQTYETAIRRIIEGPEK
jgi:hypothetical protein